MCRQNLEILLDEILDRRVRPGRRAIQHFMQAMHGQCADEASDAIDYQQKTAARHAKQFMRFSQGRVWRSEEHTSELQSLMRISYAVFCLKKKHQNTANIYL